MSRIRGRDTAPELALRRALHRRGLRYRLHDAKLPGRPDIVFPSRRAVVFVHGCFWHRHDGCRIATTPKSNTAFWQAKFDRNVERDLRNCERLGELGWTVIVVWECELSTPAKAAAAAEKVAQRLPPTTGPRRKA
jgi:DNA mismatch endonuclease (patch repair protein)